MYNFHIKNCCKRLYVRQGTLNINPISYYVSKVAAIAFLKSPDKVRTRRQPAITVGFIFIYK